MKTLIINGSPRREGDISALLAAFRASLTGEVVELSYADGITPCLDCRACWKTPGCPLRDRFSEVMGFLEDCDNVVLASPVWFSALSGVTMNIASRLQTYFAGRYFRGETTPLRHKNSALFFAGAEPGTEERAAFSARVILKHLNALPVAAAVLSMNTNEIPAAEDKTALAQARQTAELLRALTMTA